MEAGGTIYEQCESTDEADYRNVGDDSGTGLCAVISSESMKQLQSKALETLEADERASYDEQIKQQVDNVISLCQTIYDQYQAGVYTEEEAKKLAADEIRQLRYGDAGYFWVDHMTEPMWCF